MTDQVSEERKDWAGSFRAYMTVWGFPTLIILAGIFVDADTRTILWTGSLAWKGVACLLNARRCGRTHCRFTGPFYLLLIVPVLFHGLGALPLGVYGWWVLGIIILFGGKLIWWATESAWGKFSMPADGSKAR